MQRILPLLLCIGCLMAPGCHAARPLAVPLSSSRALLGAQWGGHGCSGLGSIGFGTSQALALPSHNLVLGQVTLRNSGPQPFGFQSCGVKLSGPSPLDCALRCPQNLVPAGGSLQCGFIAQAPQPTRFTSFQTFFVPQSSGGQCLNQQPFFVRPYMSPAAPAAASSQAAAFSNAGVAKSFADACAQAFGATYSDALSKATSWQGDAYSLANAIANSVFGGSSAVSNSQAVSQGWGSAASAQGSAASNSVVGPASAQSSSSALQTGLGGIASAADRASAVSGYGPARAASQSAAVNTGGGPAVASSSSSAVSGSGK